MVLANTSPRIADPAGMEARRQTVLREGMAAIRDTVMTRFFGRVLLDANPPRVASARETLLATNPTGYAGCCAAVRDFDGTADLTRIQARTLVISGDHRRVDAVGIAWRRVDASHPPRGEVRLATAHLSNLGLPRTFTRTVLEFVEPASRDAVRGRSRHAPRDPRRRVRGRADRPRPRN